MITTLVISTKDRHDQALAALDSFKSERCSIVYDQTQAPVAYPSTRVCGTREVLAFIERLVSLGFPRDVLEYGLIGGHGGFRNVAMLDTVGEHVLSTDDDTRNRLYAPPGQDLSRMNLGPANPYYDWFRDRQHWQSTCKPVEGVNVFELHEKVLGYKTQEGSSIRVTACGHIGDSASDYNYFSLGSIQGMRDRLLANYPVNRQTREVIQACTEMTVARRSPWLRTLSYAFDNTSPLPPFLPNGRGECGVFAVLLAHMHTESIAYLPWAIEHVPPLRHGYKPLAFGPDSMFYSLTQASARSSLGEISRALVGFGKLPAEQVQHFMRDAHHRSMLPQVENIQKVLQIYKREPQAWAEDVDAFVAEATVPLEVSTADALKMQREMVMFGQLCGLWFEIWDAARRLRGQGIRISKESRYDEPIVRYTATAQRMKCDNAVAAMNLHEEIGLNDVYGLREAKDLTTIVDIGAHQGFFSAWAKTLYPDARIIAIEPTKDSYMLLRENVQDIEAYYVALGNGKCLEMRPGQHTDDLTGQISHEVKAGFQSYRLPDFLRILRVTPDARTFVKIDCEGAERYILDDPQSIETLKSVGHWAMEVHFDQKIWPECPTKEAFESFANEFKATHTVVAELQHPSWGMIRATRTSL